MKKRQKTTNKVHPTNSQVQRIIKDIRNLRDSGKGDIEIRETLGLELRTFQRYTKTIYEEDKQIWYDISSQELAGELLKLRSCLNNSYDIAKKISEDETIDIDIRLEALDKKDDSRLNIVKLLVEYPTFVSQTKIHHDTDTETETHHVTEEEWRENGERVLNETE